jgi:hypothetical protein
LMQSLLEHQRLLNFEQQLEGPRTLLTAHAIYSHIVDLQTLRIFMKSHVFAVWDFMSLLKTLQRQLTCTTGPWLPPAHRETSRFINEIVVAEESDEISPGRFISHYELYLEAMIQAGADSEAIRAFTQRLANGKTVAASFSGLNLPPCVVNFVSTTLGFCRLEPHQVAAVFLFGREDIIPEMFRSLLRELNLYEVAEYSTLKMYLERHIAVDGDCHGPLARQMLTILCGESDKKWDQALCVAQEAMHARKLLWDGILHELSASRTRSESVLQL